MAGHSRSRANTLECNQEPPVALVDSISAASTQQRSVWLKTYLLLGCA